MDATGWSIIIGAIFLGLTQLTQMILSYLRDRNAALKVQEVNDKVEANTLITKHQGQEAIRSAKDAVRSASDAKVATHELDRKLEGKLNGGIDAAIKEGIAPLQQALAEHAANDEKNLKEINEKIEILDKYSHDRNHDMLGALSTINNKVTALVMLAKKDEA